MSDSILKMLAIVALSSWLGVMVFFGFVVAPTAFRVLEREAAGRLAMAIMPGYLWLGLALGLGALVGSAGRLARAQGSRTSWLGATLVGVAILATGYSLLVILPEARLLSSTVRAWRLAGGPPPPEAMRFAWIHRLSSLANLVALGAVVLALALEGWRGHGPRRGPGGVWRG
jgi:hypothetical protein